MFTHLRYWNEVQLRSHTCDLLVSVRTSLLNCYKLYCQVIYVLHHPYILSALFSARSNNRNKENFGTPFSDIIFRNMYKYLNFFTYQLLVIVNLSNLSIVNIKGNWKKFYRIKGENLLKYKKNKILNWYQKIKFTIK